MSSQLTCIYYCVQYLTCYMLSYRTQHIKRESRSVCINVIVEEVVIRIAVLEFESNRFRSFQRLLEAIISKDTITLKQ